MSMFNLELRVTEFGSILARQIFLEDVTNQNREVKNWDQGEGFQFKKLSNFQVSDFELDVFVGCQGIAGGTLKCEVFIDGNNVGDIASRVEDHFFAHKSFNV